MPHKNHNRIKLLNAHDKPILISATEARDMVSRGEAVVISDAPLVLREARFLEYKDEERRQRGRQIPGATRHDPSRLVKSDVARIHGRCSDLTNQAARHYARGGSQGRCFPPTTLPDAEREFRAYKRELLRKASQERLDRRYAREAIAARHNRRQRKQRKAA